MGIQILLGRDRRRERPAPEQVGSRLAPHRRERPRSSSDPAGGRAQAPPQPEQRTWAESTTINDAIEAWKQNGWDDLSPVTVRRYENLWKVHIKRTIGRERIAAVTPYEVEQYFRD